MKLRIAVIFGGRSVEHEISILSAMQVMHALDPLQYEVIPLYISKDGTMYSETALKDLAVYKQLDEIVSRYDPVHLIRNGKQYEIRKVKQTWRSRNQIVDIAFPVIHGTNGEDGTLQGYLALLGIPYCGCGVLGAAIGQDKVIMKQVLDHHHIPTPAWFYVHAYEDAYDEISEDCEELGYPLIIKPASLGSSVGIGIVNQPSELQAMLQQAFQFDEKAIVEKLIEPMRECNCSILGDMSQMEVSAIEEVIKSNDILSYQDKYEGNGKSKGMVSATRLLPAPISEELASQIADLAKRTFLALQASGVSRIDFIVDETKNIVYVNEINTIPGSLAFYLWTATGLSFSKLLDRIIQLALDGVRRKEKRTYSYDTNLLANYHGEGMKK